MLAWIPAEQGRNEGGSVDIETTEQSSTNVVAKDD